MEGHTASEKKVGTAGVVQVIKSCPAGSEWKRQRLRWRGPKPELGSFFILTFRHITAAGEARQDVRKLLGGWKDGHTGGRSFHTCFHKQGEEGTEWDKGEMARDSLLNRQRRTRNVAEGKAKRERKSQKGTGFSVSRRNRSRSAWASLRRMCQEGEG